MLDFDTVLELLKKYGFSSTSVHPYIYKSEESIGICYLYNDEEYGSLERIKVFDDLESFEKFLKEYSWVKENGKNFNIRIVLDNYESLIPRVLYLYNEKLLLDGELEDINNYVYRQNKKEEMDETTRILTEAGELLDIYNEIKKRQILYLTSLITLKNTLRQKYFDLQKEVDIYNKFDVERSLKLLPVVPDSGGVNEAMEVTIKDKYNIYKVNPPSLEEAKDFLREVWELNMSLESNPRYYSALKEETDVRNELKIVNRKLDYMKDLNENLKSLFGVDLMSNFRKINKDCEAVSNTIDESFISEKLEDVGKKYSVFEKLNPFYLTNYLREAFQNNNYDDLALKYAKGADKSLLNKFKLPLNEVAADLSVQYRDKLGTDEQSILVLINNHKYRKICNAILEIENFETKDIKEIIKIISKLKSFSKIKSECYDSVKKRIDDPLNSNIKQTIFANYNFETFETFISSLIKELVKLKNINNKMIVNSDVNMYLTINNIDDVKNKKFNLVSNDLNSLLVEAIENRNMIGLVLLKEKTPVLYSPYYFDLGDIYTKNASPAMSIKEMINFDLLIESSDVLININTNKVNVARYYSEPKTIENTSYVDDIKLGSKVTFCKYSFVSNILQKNETEDSVVVSPINSTEISNTEDNRIEVNTTQEVTKTDTTKEESIDNVVNAVNVEDSTNKELSTENVKSETKVEASVSSTNAGTEDNKSEVNTTQVSNTQDVTKTDTTKEDSIDAVVSSTIKNENSTDKKVTTGNVKNESGVVKVEKPVSSTNVSTENNKVEINSKPDVTKTDTSKEESIDAIVSSTVKNENSVDKKVSPEKNIKEQSSVVNTDSSKGQETVKKEDNKPSGLKATVGNVNNVKVSSPQKPVQSQTLPNKDSKTNVTTSSTISKVSGETNNSEKKEPEKSLKSDVNTKGTIVKDNSKNIVHNNEVNNSQVKEPLLKSTTNPKANISTETKSSNNTSGNTITKVENVKQTNNSGIVNNVSTKNEETTKKVSSNVSTETKTVSNEVKQPAPQTNVIKKDNTSTQVVKEDKQQLNKQNETSQDLKVTNESK